MLPIKRRVCECVSECVCVRLRYRHTFRLLEVKGISTSGGMSKPGGHGMEKLPFRNWPLIASSTSLSINTTTAYHSSATVREKELLQLFLFLICRNEETIRSSISPLSVHHFLEGHLWAVQSELPALQRAQRIRRFSCDSKKKKQQQQQKKKADKASLRLRNLKYVSKVPHVKRVLLWSVTWRLYWPTACSPQHRTVEKVQSVKPVVSLYKKINTIITMMHSELD